MCHISIISWWSGDREFFPPEDGWSLFSAYCGSFPEACLKLLVELSFDREGESIGDREGWTQGEKGDGVREGTSGWTDRWIRVAALGIWHCCMCALNSTMCIFCCVPDCGYTCHISCMEKVPQQCPVPPDLSE